MTDLTFINVLVNRTYHGKHALLLQVRCGIGNR